MADLILYRPVVDEDVKQLESLFCRSYFKEEPLAKSLNLDLPREVQLILDTHFPMIVEDHVSVAACDQRDHRNIIGARLSTIEHSPELLSFKLPDDNPDCYKMNLIFQLLKQLGEGIDFFTLHNVSSLLHFIAVSVDSNYQKKGIAKRMIEETINLCKSHHPSIEVAIVEANSAYAQKIYNGLNFAVVNEIIYDEYKINGVKIFDIPPPHTKIQLLCKKFK